MPQTLPDDEVAEGIKSLNAKQREVSDELHTSTKDYVKCDGYDVEPVHIYFSGSVGTCKFHLVKVIYITPYEKHCLIIVTTLKNIEFF